MLRTRRRSSLTLPRVCSRAFPLLLPLLFFHVSFETFLAFFLGFFRGDSRLLAHFRVRQVAVVDHDHVEPVGRLVRSNRFVQRRRQFRKDDGCFVERIKILKGMKERIRVKVSDELTRRTAKKEDVPSKSFVISPLGKYPKSPPFLFPVGQRLNFLASSSNPRSNFGRNKSSSANGSSNSTISSHNVRFDAQSMCEAWTMSMPLDLMFSLVFACTKLNDDDDD